MSSFTVCLQAYPPHSIFPLNGVFGRANVFNLTHNFSFVSSSVYSRAHCVESEHSPMFLKSFMDSALHWSLWSFEATFCKSYKFLNLWLSIAPTPYAENAVHVHHISLTVLLKINCAYLYGFVSGVWLAGWFWISEADSHSIGQAGLNLIAILLFLPL